MSRFEQMIDDIENASGVIGGIKLSQWEEEFMDSIKDRLSDEKSLTEPQIEKLKEIWDRI
jgi:hypothetical protein